MSVSTAGTADPKGALPPDDVSKLETCLVLLGDCTDERVKALHRQIDQIAHPSRDLEDGASALAKIAGSSTLAKAGSASPLGRMEIEVKDLMAKDPKRTRSQALDAARRFNPQLARECMHAAI